MRCTAGFSGHVGKLLYFEQPVILIFSFRIEKNVLSRVWRRSSEQDDIFLIFDLGRAMSLVRMREGLPAH